MDDTTRRLTTAAKVFIFLGAVAFGLEIIGLILAGIAQYRASRYPYPGQTQIKSLIWLAIILLLFHAVILLFYYFY
ncbi:hypothetical protein BK816_08275 [Boudabousia tangfeifanii]|uniref:Uncharacterized protein n=1 Tax=Boudabousia tangfeifanii TaxID=1912795 RepID=A0A1D9MLW6_9ACTO|nr:hypothetical protein [Boudabousia tangfeifanii]AOZ73275.1 hypothetical protein BK816_08275 [Boudabousia tangfeifanii]